MADQHSSALQASLKWAFETSPTATAVSRLPSGEFIAANQAFLSLHGYERHEVIGRTSDELRLWGSAEERRALLARMPAQGELHSFSHDYRHKSGRIGRALASARTLRHADQSYLIGFLTDLSALDAAQHALVERERSDRALFDNMLNGMAHCRMLSDSAQALDFVYLRVNPAFGRLTGLQDVTGRRVSDVIPDFARTDAELLALFARVAQGGPAQQLECFVAAQGHWFSMSVYSPGPAEFVVLFDVITQRKQAESAAGEIEQLAFFDTLTRLPNRRLMLDRLTQAQASASRHARIAALMLIDLDNFKALNDSLGLDLGDSLLVQVAQRLRAVVREGDTVARVGGDEFVVIAEDLGDLNAAAAHAEALAFKLQSQLNLPCALVSREGRSPGQAYQGTACVGITLFGNAQASADELLRRADTALHQAKAGGRNSKCFFDPAMQAALAARAALEADLRDAVAGGEFTLHYQAQTDRTQRVIGAEALLRWRHPRRGLVPPGEFIALAEESGLILALGHWVLETACAQLVAWSHQPQLAGLTLAVNVSARQFALPDFVDCVLRLLHASGAPPGRLKLELTESVLLDNPREVACKMTALKRHGVGFALDDFGTGYSSLAYLKRLPLDQLKIDQSFVAELQSDANDAAIVRTIIALSRSLGLSVLAEGVETDAQWRFLIDSGCDACQGHYFGHPVDAASFARAVLGGAA